MCPRQVAKKSPNACKGFERATLNNSRPTEMSRGAVTTSGRGVGQSSRGYHHLLPCLIVDPRWTGRFGMKTWFPGVRGSSPVAGSRRHILRVSGAVTVIWAVQTVLSDRRHRETRSRYPNPPGKTRRICHVPRAGQTLSQGRTVLGALDVFCDGLVVHRQIARARNLGATAKPWLAPRLAIESEGVGLRKPVLVIRHTGRERDLTDCCRWVERQDLLNRFECDVATPRVGDVSRAHS